MFLDEELLEMCKITDCSTKEKIQQLNIDLYYKCEQHYKNKLYPSISKKKAKIILDQTFNLWNSFVRMGKKETGQVKILAEIFEEYSFKKQLLSNKEMNKLYSEL